MSEEMKREILGVKADVRRLEGMMRRVMAGIVNIQARLDDTPTRAEMNARFDSMNKRIDGLTASVEDSRYRWAVHADVLTKHDKRLSRLESKRA